MNCCPITYEPCGDRLYSERGLHLLSKNLNDLKLFPYSIEEQINEAIARASKMSIQGVQPKLSARLSVKDETFEITDRKGTFILKPQNLYYKELPQNEDLTMRLARLAGMELPLHGMIYSKDNSLTYFIRRFDRTPRGHKFAVEDFAQLAGLARDNKYNYSMEKIPELINRYCTFPEIEKIKLFKLVIFNFITGNEDAHLKNFSLITRDNIISLTPCYDLLNTTIAGPGTEEIALPLAGKKNNLKSKDLIDYFGKQRLGLNEKIIEDVSGDFYLVKNKWDELINISFLSEEMKSKYTNLINQRRNTLKI
jgi:serine/threonine-protein kinase HipA